MKKLLTLTAFCACAWTVNAQTEKGKLLIGGNIGYSNSKSNSKNVQTQQIIREDSVKSISYSVAGNAGYFIQDNFAIGMGIGYSHVKSNSDGTVYYNNSQIPSPLFYSGENKSDLFFLSPFARYYVGLADNFKFFGQVSVPLSSGTQKQSGAANPGYYQEYKTTSYGVSIQPGLAFFPSKRISLELSTSGLDYYHTQFKNKQTDEKSSSNSFSFSLSTFAPRLGIVFYL
jgi:outer membrane protein